MALPLCIFGQLHQTYSFTQVSILSILKFRTKHEICQSLTLLEHPGHPGLDKIRVKSHKSINVLQLATSGPAKNRGG